MARTPLPAGVKADLPGAGAASFFGHPRGLSTLFFTELWERFSFYGMRAILILFMTASVADGGLGFEVSKAGAVYGLYTAMVYLMALPGGWLADRFLGQRKAVLYGGIVIAAGHFSMAIPGLTTFYLGLALVVAGTGLLKPNVSAMVGQLYAPEDNRRDAGFSIFYMGINIGAFLSPLACGYLGQRVDWHLGFGLAGVGMVFGIIQYMLGARHLGGAGLHPARPESPEAAASQRRWLRAALALAGATAVLLFLLSYTGVVVITAQGVADSFGFVLFAIVIGFFSWMFLSSGWTPVERRRLVVVVVLFLASSLFWSEFEQAGSTLNLFAERNTRNTILGFEYPASWLQSLNALFIITLAPVFAWLWVRLGRREPSSPAKFVFGLLFVGLGFLVLALAVSMSAAGELVSPMWLVFVYLLHTIGELCLSPVGLSAMTKLAPARVAGLMMGVWFLSTAVGNYMGGRLASLYEDFSLDQLFSAVGGGAVAGAIVLALLVRPMKKLMGGVR